MIALLRRLWRHLRPSPVEVAQDEALLTIVGAGSRALQVQPLAALLVTLEHEKAGA